jgi:signal transduction histidine kinase
MNPQGENFRLFPYLVAVLASALALYLRQALVPFIGESNPYLTVWLAVVFSSWYCGLGLSERLADHLELAIFRIVQECLTNIHRHSGSKTARVHLIQRDGYIHCEVSDEGKGISPEKQAALNSSGSAGVGLRGMRERVSQLQGTLQIRSNGEGANVEAILPVRHTEPPASGASEHLSIL